MGDDYNNADGAKRIILWWNERTGSVENILYRKVDQTDISNEDQLTIQIPKDMSDSLRPMCLKRIADDMKRAIDHSIALPREEQMRCAGKPVDFNLEPSNQDLPPMHMAAHLRTMLGNGTILRDQLADLVEDLSI